MAQKQNIPDQKYIELHAAGLINSRIAAALGVTAPAVNYRLKKLGLTPNRAESPAPPPKPLSVPQQLADPSPPHANGTVRLKEVKLGSAIDDLLHDLDRSRGEVGAAQIGERQRVGAFKDIATAYKTIEAMSKARLAVHDGWAQEVIKSFASFTQRVESALARQSESTGGTVTMEDILDVMRHESIRVQKAMQEFYQNETEGLHR